MPLLPLLQACQAQYEEMVSERMRRETGFEQDFRELRGRLRWLIDRYKIAVETLYDEDDPKSGEQVSQALRALIMLSAHMARSPAAPLDEVLEGALVDAEFFGEDEDADADADPEPNDE